MTARNDKCTLCPLHQTANYVCLLGVEKQPNDVMIIGEAPGRTEDETGKPFVGASGKLLREVLSANKVKGYITNAVACRPPQNRTPKKKEIDACNYWLKKQINDTRPKYVLLLGNIALQSVLGIKGIKKYRGKPIEKDNVVCLPTYHPSYILASNRSGNNERPIFERDIAQFKKIIDFGGVPFETKTRSKIVNTKKDVEEMLAALDGVVSWDLETTQLYPWGGKIVTLGFGTASGEYSLFINHPDSPWSESEIENIIEAIDQRIHDCIIVAQNGKFDALWMMVHYGVSWLADFDTMLGHYILDENDRHDLERLAKIYFNAEPWDISLAEKQGKAPAYKIARYHAHDLYYTRELYFVLSKELKKDKKLYDIYYKLLMPAARLFVSIEHHGAYIDIPKMKDAEVYLKNLLSEAETRLNRWAKINWGSPKQVANFLYNTLGIECPQLTPKGAPSTSESTLKQIDHPCVSDIFKYRGAKQQLSFFIEGWKPFLVKGRIHPSFKLHGTVTGRLSCEHPNWQQVPRDRRIRSLVTAPPGWVLMEADLSQIELRIVAELSGDPTMTEAYKTGLDIHWMTAIREIERGAGKRELVLSTASTLMQKRITNYGEGIEIVLAAGPDAAAEIDEEWKDLRKKAKATNFGYVYGMWWKKFKIYARDNYDIELTDEQARESRRFFFDQYYRLESWHKEQKRFARLHGNVRSLIGRKRRLPDATSYYDSPFKDEALRQAVNSPVQSLASDLNLMVLLQMVDEFPDTFRPIATVHDAILAEIRIDQVEKIVKRIEQVMEKPDLLEVFGVKLNIPICGEVKLGPWGSGVSLKKYQQARVA